MKHEVFSAKKAKYLTRWLRNILQNPHKILKPYVKDGMTVLDFGCGPGFFTIEAAKLAGESGKVIAVDLQQEMLNLLAERIKGSNIEKRIDLNKCEERRLNILKKVDLFLAFHVVHELPDADAFFREAENIIKAGGMLFISEPKKRVSKLEFGEMIIMARKHGFTEKKAPKIFFDRVILLMNSGKTVTEEK